MVSLEWTGDYDRVEIGHLRPNGRELVRVIEGSRRTVVSGLDEGSHQFRLRAEGDEWGEVLKVESHYMDRTTVIRLLVAGGVIVSAVAGAILIGSFRKEEE